MSIASIQQYFKDSVEEMKKVIWPNKKQTIQYTIVVIVLSIGTAVFIGLMDYIFQLGLENLIK